MVKSIYFFLIIINFYCAYSQTSKTSLFSSISLNAGTFFAAQTKIESEETAKLLEKYSTPGISFGLSYILEKPHLFYSGGLAARILPVGFKLLIKNKDLIGKPEDIGTYDVLFNVSEYYYDIFSIPLKIGYQTIENNAKQKFWIATGIEANFTTEMGLSMGSSSSTIDLETESYQKAYPTFSLEGGVSKVQKNGDQLKFGLEYNISNTNIIDGAYTVNLKNSTVNGTYRDTGTYIGFNFAYVFKLKKQ